MIRRIGLAAPVAAVILLLCAAGAFAGSPNIVVSQVYGGGGNAGATYTNDFIELFNRGTAPASVTGWSVQYAASTGTTWQRTPLTGVTIQPGQYYLVQEGAGAGGTTPLPTPDATGTIAMSATAAKVALVNNNTTITSGTSCPSGATIVDFVGYGSAANCSEGSGPTATLSNTTAALRGGGGCTDTDNNAGDFTTGGPNPRNTASPLNPCPVDLPPSVSSTTPADGATGVPTDANITVQFSEPVNVNDTWFTISCGSSAGHTATVSGGPTTYTLDPDVDFANSETCTVTIHAAQVSDVDVIDPPDTMTADYVFTFTTAAPPVAIHDIQGASHLSPFAGQVVSTMPATVIAKRTNGFWMQDVSPDGSDASSEGIFVFTSSAPAVNIGDSVKVGGRVSEFRAGGASGLVNLTITELTSPTVTVLSSGNPLPAPIVIGTGGRIPPSTVIEDDATGDVETSGVFDPAADGIDFYESLEGMRVQIDDAVAVGRTSDFGSNREIPVLGDNGANASVRTARGGIVIRPNDFNPERIILNDVVAGGPVLPPVSVSDTFPGATVGVIDYSFGNFKLEVSSLPAPVSGGLTQEQTAAAGAGTLSLATFNVENLDPLDPPTKFVELASLIVDNLASPDLISVEEVQDDNGPVNDSTTDATVTWTELIAAIQAVGGPTYDFRQINPVDGQDGGEPGGNIRVGFLFRTDRGLSFVDRPGGGSTTATAVVSGLSGPELTFSPGRIDPTNSAFNSSRKPLAGEFLFHGRHLFVIGNHFNSKGGDQPLFGHFQPPTLSSETQRHQQAQIVNGFVDQILALDPNASVVALGDFNDFEFSQTINLLEGGVLSDLLDTLPQSERYSYVFEGNSQTLDHVLLSDELNDHVTSFDAVHVNAEFAVQASDHDPLVAHVCADSTAPTLSVSASPSTLWPPNHQYVDVTVTASSSDDSGTATVTFVSATSNEPDDAPGGGDGNTTNDIVQTGPYTFKLRAERAASGSGRIYTLTYVATDACGNTTTKSATVTVPVNKSS